MQACHRSCRYRRLYCGINGIRIEFSSGCLLFTEMENLIELTEKSRLSLNISGGRLDFSVDKGNLLINPESRISTHAVLVHIETIHLFLV